MENGLKPLSYAMARLGYGKKKIYQIAASDPAFPMTRERKGAQARFDPLKLEAWIEKRFQNCYDNVRAAAAGTGEVRTSPELDAFRAASDFRYMLTHGCEPEQSPYWRNAARLGGDVPGDIAAAFNIANGASWGLAVEKAEKLLGLRADQRKIAMGHVADRLAAYTTAKMEA